MDFSIRNLLAFQNLLKNKPELFSEEVRLSLSKIIPQLEEDLEKILETILEWCESYQEINNALESELENFPDEISERSTKGTSEIPDSERNNKGTPEIPDSPDLNVQDLIELIRDFASQTTTPKTEIPLEEETYHTDISCPRRVWVNTKRISVTVCLTVKPSELSNAEETNKLSVSPQLPVIISIDAPAFKILNQKEQEIYIKYGKDSSFVVFELQPIEDQLGHQRIHFYFHQANHQIGYNFVRVEITSYEVSNAAKSDPSSVFLQSFPDKSLAPDFMLYIEYDQSKNARSLKFKLYENGESISFEPKELKTDLESYIRTTIYKKFKKLTPGERSRKFNVANPEIGSSLEDKQRPIKILGWKLWKDLIPQELKDRYIANRTKWRDKTLLIMSDDPYIPWELVWPYNEGKNYDDWREDEYPWCISMKMTRWLNHNVPENDKSTPPTRINLNQLACIAPRYPEGQELKNAQREQEHLTKLCKDKNIDDTTPQTFSSSKIYKLLQTGNYDWLHIAAHGKFNSHKPNDASAIYLEEGEKLTIYDLIGPDIERHIRSTRPAFFFNACDSGRQAWGMAGLGGWPDYLISGGASLLIAPLWRVDDEAALVFARKFYEELLNSKTVAEAVQLSRKAAFNQYFKTQGDATWFTYSVYAHPNARISLEHSK